MNKTYPCDLDGFCPYGEGIGMYFCRDNCGLGVDEDSYQAQEDSQDEIELEICTDKDFYNELRMEQQE